MAGKITSVKIRMYNTGSVGDCLLLLFQKGADTTFRMLIDCGGWNTTAELMVPCVEDIRQVTGGKLDLMIVTHQHEDHVSGFNLARKVFDKIDVNEVWMSWVEDATDPVAATLKKKYGKKLKELKKVTSDMLTGLNKVQADNNIKGAGKHLHRVKSSLQQTMQLLAFEEGTDHGKHLAVGSKTNDDAMEYVRTKGRKLHYRQPGEVTKDIAGAEGIKFYILGPPRDKDLKFLRVEMNEDEMYHLAATTDSDSTQDIPVNSGVALRDLVSPFADKYHMTGVEKNNFFKKYNSSEWKWRQIETDWLSASNQLALALTSLTNNTSLAMALEFEGSGKVILLPGDAQSGNWMSWHKPEVMSALKKAGGKNTDELLANTVFYKTGHHGSHNGTASKSGLEMMKSDELIAFMPLVQNKIPSAWGGSENFPAEKLYKTLIGKTKGRIVRTDEGIISDTDAKKQRSMLSATDNKEFQKNVVKGSCYYEFTVKG